MSQLWGYPLLPSGGKGREVLPAGRNFREIPSLAEKGKKVMLSLGGAAGSYGFPDDPTAQKFAHTLWNMFFAGTDPTVPKNAPGS